uniref:Uncharacterized protein n=1 Tax=Rhizophora mucronata TaxID=61149 RepID=A0A2P2QTL3_RHIMU
MYSSLDAYVYIVACHVFIGADLEFLVTGEKFTHINDILPARASLFCRY